MPNLLKFTCVPMGITQAVAGGSPVAKLDVLISPSFEDQKKLDAFMSWGTAVLQVPRGFHLAGRPNVNLTLQADLIQPALWNILLSDALVPAAIHPSGAPGPASTPITENGVSMDNTQALARKFYSTALKAPSIKGPKSFAVQMDVLRQFRDGATGDHSIYRRHPGDDTPVVDLNSTQPDDVALIALLKNAEDVPESGEAEKLILNRFGVHAPYYSDAIAADPAHSVSARPAGVYVKGVSADGQHAISAPPKALNALGHIKIHLINSLRLAAGNNNPLPTVPPPAHLAHHVNRLIVSPSHRSTVAAMKKINAVQQQPAYDFNQRISMLMNAPAILETLGLILHFELPAAAIAGLGSIALDSNCPAIIALSTFATPTLCNTMCTAATFLAQSRTAGSIRDNGWMEPSDGYNIDSLQLESSAMQISQFASQAALRAAAPPYKAVRNVDPQLVVSYDEDVDHPILPPSPHTGGLQVWKKDLQAQVAQKRAKALMLRKAADSAASCDLYAEDLRNGIVVDILAFGPHETPGNAPGKWIHLCQRSEEFDLHGVHISRKRVNRGVRTAAANSKDPGNSAPLSSEVDETIFTWRLGSLVAKSPLVTEPGIPSGTPLQKRTDPAKQIPWGHFDKPKYKTEDDIPSPQFGWTYYVSMRAAFVTGGVVPFDAKAASDAAMKPFLFQRNEFYNGPVSIPVTITDHYLEDQSPSLVLTGSKIGDDLSVQPFSKISQRLLVPPQMSPEVARRHGKPESDIAQGATVLPLTDGALPAAIGMPSPANDSTGPAYCPDPACIGMWAYLTTLNGDVITTRSLLFYDKQRNISWPNYAPHMLELHWINEPTASLTVGEISGSPNVFPFLKPPLSKAFICKVPPGQTYLCHLRPMRDPTDAAHSFAGFLPDSTGPAGLDATTLSDLFRPTIIRLTHATDRPVVLPSVTVTVPGVIVTGGTPIEVPDVKQLSLGATADPFSTSKVALLVAWEEITDDLHQPASSLRQLSAQIAEFNFAKKMDKNQIAAIAVQFPFSDSRYRSVTVTPRGTARYGGHFGKLDKRTRTIDGPPVTLDVLATAAPKPPDIEFVLHNRRLHVSPDGKKRTRGTGLTVVLNRPWFTSGIGEELAIITAPVKDQSSPVIDSIATSFSPNTENEVSSWGVLADFAQSFPKGAGSQTISFRPDPAAQKSDPRTDDLPTMRNIQLGGAWYSAACYKPRYNEQDQQWYVNLSLSAPPAYGAVVRLLAARYQHHAIAGCQVSDAVLCDFMLVRPERSVLLTTVRTGLFGRHTRIQVLGIGPAPKVPAPGNQITPHATIEVRHFETQQNEPRGFEWKALDVVTPDPGFPAGNVLWQGTLPIHMKGTLVVQETEIWPSAEDRTAPAQIPAYFDIFLG
jgi:hypothetical protein